MANFGDALAGVAVGFASAVSDPALKQKRQEKRVAQGISNSLTNDFANTPYAEQAEQEFREAANNKNTRKTHTALYSSYASGNIDIFHKDDPLTQGRKVRSYPGATNFVFSPKPATVNLGTQKVNAQTELMGNAKQLALKMYGNTNLSKLKREERGQLMKQALLLSSPKNQQLIRGVSFGEGLSAQQELRRKTAVNLGIIKEQFFDTGIKLTVNEEFGRKNNILLSDVYKAINHTEVSNAMYALLADAVDEKSSTQKQSQAILQNNQNETNEIAENIKSNFVNSIIQPSEDTADETLVPEVNQAMTVEDKLQDPKYSERNLALLSLQKEEGQTNEELATELTKDALINVNPFLAQNEEVFQNVYMILFDRLERGEDV